MTTDHWAAGVMLEEEARESRPQKAARLLRTFAADPVGITRSLPGEIRQKYGSIKYAAAEVDQDWHEHLHGLLGAAWPCPETRRVDELTAGIEELLASHRLRSGRRTYGWYSDAESSWVGLSGARLGTSGPRW
jgi:hypothetical protein